jgi:hypothetical protein
VFQVEALPLKGFFPNGFLNDRSGNGLSNDVVVGRTGPVLELRQAGLYRGPKPLLVDDMAVLPDLPLHGSLQRKPAEAG